MYFLSPAVSNWLVIGGKTCDKSKFIIAMCNHIEMGKYVKQSKRNNLIRNYYIQCCYNCYYGDTCKIFKVQGRFFATNVDPRLANFLTRFIECVLDLSIALAEIAHL